MNELNSRVNSAIMSIIWYDTLNKHVSALYDKLIDCTHVLMVEF